MKKNPTTLSDARERTFPMAGYRGLALLFIFALLFGCVPGSDVAGGGTSGTGLSRGPITAFGSAFVTEIEWELEDAELELDGLPASEGDLRLGMVVRIEGDVSNDGLRGTAKRLVFDDSVEGVISDDPVDVVPGVERQFTVLGLTVVIHASNTHYDDGASFDALAKNDVVEVSGLQDDGGKIRATRVELKGAFQPDVSRAELRGTVEDLVKNIDGSGMFDLGPVVVRYTPATDFDDGLTRESLAEGLFVEAEGTLRSSSELDASEIEFEDEGFEIEDAEDVKVRGFVSGFTSIDDPFEVSGMAINGSAARLEPSNLVIVNGLEVEVGGALVEGVLVAREIESEDEADSPDSVRIEAAVASIDGATRTLVALGVTVRADGGTEIRDDRDDEPNFRFEDIEVGDWVEVDGIEDGAASVTAGRIRRDEVEDDVLLQGPVTAFDSGVPSLSILDQSIPIDGGTQYRDFDESPLTEQEFFDLVDLESVVKAKDQGAADPAVLGEADEVEFED